MENEIKKAESWLSSDFFSFYITLYQKGYYM